MAFALGAITGGPDTTHAEPSHPRIEVRAINPVPVMNQIPRLPALRRGVQELLPDPRHGWVPGDIEVHQVAACVLDEEQHLERLEGQGLQDRLRPPIAPDRSGTNDEAELEQLASNPLGSPQWVLAGHPRDEGASFGR